ncbi:MAG TPA: DUF4920 domain-containing protein [Myxococcota bacterium]|nr:DUF4920 domain-containing protein [Myxococcota bacterium]
MLLSLLFSCATETPEVTTVPDPVTAPEVVEAAQSDTHFGADFTVDEVVKAELFLADPSGFEGQTVRLEGRVADVCQKKGCWIVVAHEDKTVRVLMKDHSFSVAKDGTGRTAQVEGIVEATEPEESFVKHLEEESEHPEAMPEKQAGTIYQIQATAVRFLPEA